jgi:hypothetical protein
MGDDNHDIDGDVVNDDNDGDDNSDKDDDDQDEEEEEDGATLELEVDSDHVYLSDSVDDNDDDDDDDDDHAAKDSTRSHKTIRSSSSSSFNRSTKDTPRASSAHKTINAMTTKGELDMRMRMRKHDGSDGGGDDDDMREVVMKVLRSCFGFTSFRPGQLWAIERCLTKKNSLLVLPTGAGKSLCYMLPAAVLAMTGGRGGGGGMGGLTIVVSPLIALMQVRATA